MATSSGPQHDPDNVPPSGPPTHWIDTNTLLEVYSHGDLYDAFERFERGEGPISDVEARRVRLQGSLWMAMALCQVKARSISFEHENVRNILRLAPPNTERGGWTSTIVWMLGDYGVFDGWERHMTNEGASLSNRDRDRLMVRKCREQGLILITRDAEVIGEAIADGVDAVEPEAFAARHITRDDARRMFEQRMGDAAIRYLVAGTPQDQNLRMKAGRRVREVYGAIWQRPEQPWFR